jgi:hypothetical protein
LDEATKIRDAEAEILIAKGTKEAIALKQQLIDDLQNTIEINKKKREVLKGNLPRWREDLANGQSELLTKRAEAEEAQNEARKFGDEFVNTMIGIFPDRIYEYVGKIIQQEYRGRTKIRLPMDEAIKQAKALWKGERGADGINSFKREAIPEMRRIAKEKSFKDSSIGPEVAIIEEKADDARKDLDQKLKEITKIQDNNSINETRIRNGEYVDNVLKNIIEDTAKKQIALRLEYKLKPTPKPKTAEDAIGIRGEGRRHKHRRHGGCESCGGNDRYD